ncbi:hypothetical protein TRVL_07740 [Trypanosoma vivax]|nr:hypothetical protein TRVL_07740 [Trypanosoma vivax]
MDTPVTCAARTSSGGGCSWSTWHSALRMYCRLLSRSKNGQGGRRGQRWQRAQVPLACEEVHSTRVAVEANGTETPGKAAMEWCHGGSGRTQQRWRDRAGGTGASGICVPVVPSRPREQDVAHQAQVRSNLYHKLGRLERGGTVCHSSESHL